MNVKVENMYSTAGNPMANQFIIYADDCVYFQSYSSVIAKRDKFGSITLDENYWNYSPTTGKYRNMFLGETIKETREKIKSGEYKLENLN